MDLDDRHTGSAPAQAGVLVVDDYSPNLRALEAVLGATGALTLADSGPRALEELARRDYAVVVLDVQMPGMDGIEVARRIRSGARNAQVPIIFVTAMDSDAAPTLEGYAAGAVDYLRRPIEPVVLKAKVAIFLELHRSREQARQEAAARAQLEAERAAAERASEEKDHFLALLSHELRTPLTSILLWSDLLLNKDLPPEMIQRGLETIDTCANLESHLVDNVLEMSRIVTGSLALDSYTFDLSEAIADGVRALARFAADRRVHVVVDIHGVRRHARGDGARIRHAIFNVLHNAIRFTAPGGRAEIAVEDADGATRIRVSDTGAGFSPSDRWRLFSRFSARNVRAVPGRSGLGLGLAVAKAVLDLHGATIEAESDGVGLGASFTITLPRELCEELDSADVAAASSMN